MGKLIVSENVTLDGVIQDPAGDEGFRAGGWVGLIKNSPQLGKLALDEAMDTEALLLGRRSYEWLAARWPSRTGELADRLNSVPKYVVSSTLEHPAWNNSTVLPGDVLKEVSGPASACSVRPATRNPCASSIPRPSRPASPSSPTSASGTPSGEATRRTTAGSL